MVSVPMSKNNPIVRTLLGAPGIATRTKLFDHPPHGPEKIMWPIHGGRESRKRDAEHIKRIQSFS